MTEPVLVLLAAGMGSRFGGPKQLEPLGPNGETIIDYSLHDAARSGFGGAVLVIRPEMRETFEQGVVRRWQARFPIQLVAQDHVAGPVGRTELPPRTKPWGTGQAVHSVRRVVDVPFAVANADDFYGRPAFERLGKFLSLEQRQPRPTYALISYPLGDTLSESGGVNRAVLRTSSGSLLEDIEEVRGIERADGGARVVDGTGASRELSLDTPVSMNLWGFTPEIFSQLERGFATFLREHGDDASAEFLLPTIAQELIATNQAAVTVLPTSARWCGLTHPQDRDWVRRVLREMSEDGEYPSSLWEAPG